MTNVVQLHVKQVIDCDSWTDFKSELQHYELKSVSDVSGVCQSTMYLWLSGATQFPRLSTILKVAKAIGWELKFQPIQNSQKIRSVS